MLKDIEVNSTQQDSQMDKRVVEPKPVKLKLLSPDYQAIDAAQANCNQLRYLRLLLADQFRNSHNANEEFHNEQ